jgi:hypothetical protein
MSTAKTVKPATTNITELSLLHDTLATASNADLRKLGSKAALAELKAREKAGVVVAGGTVTAKAPKGRVSNRFTPGTAMFHCNNCGRGTRDTGRGDNEGVGSASSAMSWQAMRTNSMDGKEFSDSDKHTINEYLRQLSTFVGRKAYDLHPELVAAVTAAPNSGINPEKAPKAVLKEVVTATPKRTQEAQKPSAVKKVTVNTKVRAKVVKAQPKAKAPKAAPAPEPTRYTEFMVWDGDKVIDVLFDQKAMSTEEAHKHYSMKYTQPVTVTTMEEGHKRNAYLKTVKKGAKGPKAKATPKAKGEKAQKAGKKAPAAPKGDKGLSPTMLAELERIANGVYEDSKTASCARMHLKMRGLIEGNPTEGYTVTRPQ